MSLSVEPALFIPKLTDAPDISLYPAPEGCEYTKIHIIQLRFLLQKLYMRLTKIPI